ncbi:unnamed protein product [Rhizoctonia solani]|uniref:Uncharacterized protein n=1 Tax=Rhizoctonia solani TaxID=456999 RepID=A0A8H3APU2_9AGAM|nr:unnamed protein product [Rhizoctonia solani]
MALQQLEPNSLTLALTTLSFVTSPFKAPRYNLPIHLFGIYALDKTESNEPLRLIPTFLILLQTLKARGDQYAHSISGGGSGGGGGFQSQTVWSMPGGFRQGGYDPVGDDLEGAAPPPPPHNVQSANPSHHHQPLPQGQAPQTAAPGGYQAS